VPFITGFLPALCGLALVFHIYGQEYRLRLIGNLGKSFKMRHRPGMVSCTCLFHWNCAGAWLLLLLLLLLLLAMPPAGGCRQHGTSRGAEQPCPGSSGSVLQRQHNGSSGSGSSQQEHLCGLGGEGSAKPSTGCSKGESCNPCCTPAARNPPLDCRGGGIGGAGGPCWLMGLYSKPL
jgi:hypothetical protein